MSTKNLNLKINAGVQGFYQFKVINSVTGLERNLGEIIANESPNIIVDSGLNQLGTNANLLYQCVVGTGSTPATASQTSLASQIASTTTIQTNAAGAQATAPYFGWYRRTFRFEQGIAAGNLTEIGIKTSSSGNPLFSRALIVDSQGNPTTLTILSDEYLDVTYELRFYPKTTDTISTITLMGVEYTITARSSKITSSNEVGWENYGLAMPWSNDMVFYNGVIGSITGQPSGSSYGHSLTFSNYVNNSYEMTFIYSAGLNNANFSGGIQSLWLRTTKGFYQFGISPAIPKDNYTTLVLNVTLGWSRYDS